MDESPDGKQGTWYGWSGLRYFLYEYETALALDQGGSPKVPWEELNSRDLQDSIEHILPQSISGQRYWEEMFTEERHAQYVHDLGNLTLTRHNSTYLNKPFPEKRGAVNAEGHCYAKSPFFVERELAQWEGWDADAIDERRTRLLEWAQQRWTIESGDPTDTVVDIEPDETDEDADGEGMEIGDSWGR